MVQIAAAQCEVASVEPNSSAILVSDLCAEHLHVFNSGPRTYDDPRPLAHCALAAGVNFRATADPANRQVVCINSADVADISTGSVDFYNVGVDRCAKRRARGGVHISRSDRKGFCQ